MLYFKSWKIALVGLVCLAGVIFVLPNVLGEQTLEALPSWYQPINLGLDLQGGSHLLLEVEADALVRERLDSLVGEIRDTLRRERIGYIDLGAVGNAVTVTILEPEAFDRASELVSGLNSAMSTGLLGTGSAMEFEFSDENPRIVMRISDAAVVERKRSAVEQSIEIVRRRVDELGTSEPTIQRQGAERILVQLPGVREPDRIKRLLGKTAKLTFQLLDGDGVVGEAERRRVPTGSEILPADDPAEGRFTEYLVQRRIMVSGEMLVSAQATVSQQTNEWVVSFRFDSVGAKRFADVTSANVNRPFAIVLDGKVVSAPVIREPILGGSGQISGRFTPQEANDLALLLRAGALPAPLEILEERTVGPDLGADSVAQGKIAAVIGFLLVIVFMAASYGLFGLFSNIALVMNMILLGGVLSALQASLTLPGIAGIVLTIGMAVDANVLIFERIKEEVRSGKTPFAAIEAGYKRALTTILDSNITTLIAAVILFLLGSGPVKGFAVTLGIGIVTSFFTAVVVSRLLVVTWLRRWRPAALPL